MVWPPRVLLQSRTTLFSVPGGDTVQVTKTGEVLRRYGCDVRVSTELQPDLSSVDIVHLFNLMRPQETYPQAVNAVRQGKAVVLSTIYGPYAEFDRRARGGLAGLMARALPHSSLEYFKVMARTLRNAEANRGTWLLLRAGYRTLQLRLIELVDVLLPNSEAELKRVVSDFPCAQDIPFAVVPNGIDADLFDPERTRVPARIQAYEGCVLSVARIEGRKCQLELVRAARDLPWTLLLIGDPAPNHRSYYRRVMREAPPNVRLLPRQDHVTLAAFYKVARVHALISWMETPGLSSLEAGVMGCRLVVTDKGDTRPYFGDDAFYCDPQDVESIRTAIASAYAALPNERLRRRILAHFTWGKAAQKTLDGYRIALNVRGKRVSQEAAL